LDPSREAEAAFETSKILHKREIPLDEQADYVLQLIDDWKAGLSVEPLSDLVTELLLLCGGEDLRHFHSQYFEAHKKLTDVASLSFEGSRLLLNQVRLIRHLILSEKMSCSQVARILNTMTRTAPYSWLQVQTLVPFIGLSIPEVSRTDAKKTYSKDLSAHLEKFADSTRGEELERLVSTANSLGFPGNSDQLLDQVTSESFSSGMLVALHFLLAICEKYDHPLSEAYEFKPRGEAAKYLQSTHPQYQGKGSAFLNIAKASPVLNSTWAWGRKPDTIGDALIFAELLQCFEDMPYTARREMASWLRQWIVRTNQRLTVQPRLIPEIDSFSAAEDFIENLIDRETHTYGTIEQRVVDALSLLCHPSHEWRSHGRKDSVYATNLSRRKLGDCEYIHRKSSRIHAYEAHAGRLTIRYMKDHFGSLASVLKQRNDDLEARDQASDWEIRITFVAHRIDPSIEALNLGVEGYDINVETESYSQLFDRSKDSFHMSLEGSVNDNIVGALNEQTVPQEFRDRVAEIANLSLR
jgi:hypothetical protein